MRSHRRLQIIMPDEIVHSTAAEKPAASPYELRPMASVRRIALFEREVREHLSQTALDAIFARLEILSEGECNTSQGKRTFLGSTMLTCDVSGLAQVLREPADEGTARRLATLLATEKTLDDRVLRIVRREVERITAGKPRSLRGETGIRIQGTRVFLDIDVEAVL